MRITSIDIQDIRFPTSDEQHGSDAVHVDPDYSAAYVVIRTDGEHQGHGLAFTCGRGTEVICSAIRALSPMVVGRQLEETHDGNREKPGISHDSGDVCFIYGIR